MRQKMPQKNIVSLSKRVARNTQGIGAVSSGIMRYLPYERGFPPNIVFLSKRALGNIVFLSKDYCVPG
jgi:hypothetical protein